MFFNNHFKEGKGINKRDPNQPRWQVFLDVFPRKLWDLFKLNILYLLTSIPFFVVTMIVMGIVSSPIVDMIFQTSEDVVSLEYDIFYRVGFSFLFMIFFGLGPVTAGFVYIVREHVNERPCTLISDFFEMIRFNFKQGILLWIIDLIVLCLFTMAIRYYYGIGIFILKYIVMLIALVYLIMHIYVYQILVTYDLSLKNIVKNSVLIGLGKAPINLIILAFNIILYVIIPWSVMNTQIFPVIIVLEVFLFPPITYFVTIFCVFPILRKYEKK